ncbi:MAG TPA: alanine racemase [Bryobacteraceae bacterium]|nr:alanine racemase [Bryobacteraceae bacterium]
MTSRRSFLQAGAAGAMLAGTVRGARSEYSFPELEARIARKDFRGITKADLPTPCMVLEQELFEANVHKMAEHCKANKINLRAHVKIHKCPEISKRQQALGAIGVCCATIAEVELMSGSGIRGVLHTCQPVGRNKVSRAIAVAKKDPTVNWVVDDPITVDTLEEAAGAAHTKMNVVVDVYAGLTRQGIQPGDPALALAQKVDKCRNLRLIGIMGYSGGASHTHGFEARKQRSAQDIAGMLETAHRAKESGLPIQIITGGSTGTYNIDVGSLTELQAGSYIFMDTLYRKIGGKDDPEVYSDWQPALTVLTTVISKTRPNQAAIDAGNKALLRPTDQVKGRPGVRIENGGAEYGMLLVNDGDRDFKLGDQVEIYPSNLDMSTNVYDRYYVARGEQIVDVWPIMGRAGAPQR